MTAATRPRRRRSDDDVDSDYSDHRRDFSADGDGVPAQRSNGTAGMPAWLVAVLRLGVTSAIALWFVWRLTTGIEDRLKGLETQLDLHMRIEVEQSGSSERLTGILQEHIRDVNTMSHQVRQTCINTGKNDEQRAVCLQ